jgi:hypothetical protein
LTDGEPPLHDAGMLTSALVVAFVSAAAPAPGEVPGIDIAPLDVGALRVEDEIRAAGGLPPRYAVPHPVAITPATDGLWEANGDGSLSWRLRLRCPGAVSMNLGLTRWRPPAGTRLLVTGADGRALMRPFTEHDGARHGELWTPPAPGDTIIVELAVPAGARRAAETGVRIGAINPGYRAFHEMLVVGGSLPCNIDVACPEAEPWRDEVAGVAVISTGGSTFCSGFMVNNVRGDRTPYFMTAKHCGITAVNAPSLVAFWNFENSTCRPPGSAESGGPGDGTLDQFTTGSTFRAAYGPSDFTLVELDANPDPSWGVSYCGFSAVDVAPDGAVGIHHPAAAEKRISFDDDQTLISGFFGGGTTHIHVTDWDGGTTEGGSSGSPLFDLSHRVVGQLHGGDCAPHPCDFCDELVFDYYGRFAISWNGGGTPSTRLRDWLDPDATGTLIVDTLLATDLRVAPTADVVHTGPVGGPFTGATVEMTIENAGDVAIEWTAAWSGDVPLLLDGESGPVSAVLPAGAVGTLAVALDRAVLSLDAGVYESDLVIAGDEGTTFTIGHRLEVAQADVIVTPETSAVAAGHVGGPFIGGATYALENVGSVAATVAVESDAAWLDPPGMIVIDPGTTVSVALAPGSAAASLPAGAYVATARITSSSGGLGEGDDGRRHLVLDVGGTVDVDACETPQPIRSGVWPIDTTSATTGPPFNDFDACFDWGQPQVRHDVWYRFEACADGVLTASTCGTVNWDSRIAIYEGGACDAPMIACNDDGDGCSGYTTLVQAAVAAGTTYLIRVGSYAANDTGTGTLRVNGPDDCPCPADLDGDGAIGFADLLVVLADWGKCGAPCAGDVDGDGEVGLGDLLIVLSTWGACA